MTAHLTWFLEPEGSFLLSVLRPFSSAAVNVRWHWIHSRSYTMSLTCLNSIIIHHIISRVWWISCHLSFLACSSQILTSLALLLCHILIQNINVMHIHIFMLACTNFVSRIIRDINPMTTFILMTHFCHICQLTFLANFWFCGKRSQFTITHKSKIIGKYLQIGSVLMHNGLKRDRILRGLLSFKVKKAPGESFRWKKIA